MTSNIQGELSGSKNQIKDYYTGCVRQEWKRLVKDAYHRLEFETTLHFLEKHLPSSGLVLDAGGDRDVIPYRSPGAAMTWFCSIKPPITLNLRADK